MCGIAGLVRFAGLHPEERGIGAAMAATLRHRGPDDTGSFDDACASLGHTRLSIIDLAGGHQPISNEDGSVWVVFNGEIYNHHTLAADLRSRGHRLRTDCDTEVLVHLYEDYREAFVERLNGMFALAIWDAPRRTLLLARDRLGIKPLYWHDDGRRIAFGSELKAVLAAGDAPRRVDPCALADYLTFGHVPAPRTIFEGVRKLEPGCLARCTPSGVSTRRYWDIPLSDVASDTGRKPASGAAITAGALPTPNRSLPRDDRGWIDAFGALFQDAVAMRMIADVPLGAFLSGGVDSTAVVTAMHRRGSGDVLTQTVGFDESSYDERDAASLVATRLGTDHREVVVRPDAAWAAEHLARHFDEPFADSSAVPTFYLSKVARERVTVALAGDGGDEMLAGYRRYRFDLAEGAIRALCPPWLRRSTAGAAGRLYPKGDWLPRPLRAKVTLQNLAEDDITAHLRSVSLCAGTLPMRLLRPERLAELRGYDPFDRGRELFDRCGSSSLLNRLLYVDMKSLLADDILTKVDRASMAVGLEVRVPLLDHRVVELAARMPTSLKRDGRRDKIVLRETVAGWLGPDVAGRRKKGFDVPVDAWFRGPLREMGEGLLRSPASLCGEWVRPEAVRRVMRLHQKRVQANGHVLWALLNLELWARAYADQASSAPHRTADHRPRVRTGAA
jgi:asparagine synthase (glutamine-hydrolysing)